MNQVKGTELLSYDEQFPEDQRESSMWYPQDGPQYTAWSSDVDELLYGGARGGGKTSYLLGDFLKQYGEYGHMAQGIIFRRSYKQLDEIVKQGWEMYCNTGIAKFNRSKSDYSFYFENGAVLKLRHITKIDDTEEYQGHEYTFIGFDEATNFRDFRIFERMRACARNKHKGVKSVMRYTANPGGLLHNEIKSYFVSPAPLGGKIIKDDDGNTRMFVRSLVTDNKILMEADPRYVKYLSAIKDPQLRKAWLEGSWDVALGSFFGDLWDAQQHILPTFSPRKIPVNWPRYRSMDWGSSKPYCVLWWTIANGGEKFLDRYFPHGSIIVYREDYGCMEGEFDVGVKLTSNEVGNLVVKTERDAGEHEYVKPGESDPALWAVKDGKSTGWNLTQTGAHFLKGDNSRVVGWEQVRTRLKGVENEPYIYFNESCTATIRTLPVIARDEKKHEDVDTFAEDHACDVVRYICMARKMPNLTNEQLFHREEEERTFTMNEVGDEIYGG